MKFNIIIDIIIVSVIWITATLGYKKGLIKTLYGLAAFICAAIITALFYENVSDYLMSLSFVNELVSKMNQSITKTIMSTTDMSLIMPAWMSDIIVNAGNSVSDKIIEIIIMIVTVIITFLISKLVLGLMVGILDRIMKLPLLDTINKTGGMLAGIIRGVLIVLICFAIVSMFVATDKYQNIHNEINNTYIAKYFYNNNILMRIIMK